MDCDLVVARLVFTKNPIPRSCPQYCSFWDPKSILS